jgi:primosomal protein N' (replication factor Y)
MESGLVTTREVSSFSSGSATPANELPLNPAQQAALEAVLQAGRTFRVFLLHGITGSGKTEVYMQLLRSVLAEPNTQALVLVPEINLTPQLEARFRTRFPQLPMVMLHSKMNESERLHGWMAAQSGEARIVIGTRLSVFTPLLHLALIVVDEEHDASYKQQDGMRYSARDVAVMRGKMANVPVVLGSATPALETWHNARSGRYQLLQIHQRAVTGAQLPPIHCIDMRGLPVDQALSPHVVSALKQRMQRGEQSLLFLNRRGYSPVLLCSQCSWVVPCKRCSSRLVVHLRDKRLRCHHCGHEQRFPQACPDCGNPDLRPVGQGTQRLEELLAQQLPEARILRVDSDSMRRKHAVAEMSQQVHDGQVDILIGTQMLAKGHDFPNLTLVVVVDADSALFSPDFRAAERLFAQLMQVAGRAGRADKAGEVLIQTAFPDHVLFHALQSHDYPAFAQTLLEERKTAHFPPYCFEALLRAEAPSWMQVEAFMRGAAECAGSIPHRLNVYDPVRPRMERLKGLERAQLLVQAGSRQALQKFLQAWVAELRTLPQSAKVRWSVDVDPLEY